ncbi:hypothetical protein TDB9533_02172 [Thalassocella blandensis]|nr:hypothetical protein TDB9533_02172 [Thalassocella blandensis]
MLYESGRVVAVERDGLWVETLKQSACGKCAAKAGCGQKLLSEFSIDRNMTLIKAVFSPELPEESWQVGDQAMLGIDRQALVKAALVSYLLPLFSMLLGLILIPEIFERYFSREILSVLGAVLGLASGGLIVRWHSYSAKGRSCYQAQVVGRALLAEE